MSSTHETKRVTPRTSCPFCEMRLREITSLETELA